MTVFVAFLRAVNVGGAGVLRMADLRALAEELGLQRARTLLASGNLVFESDLAALDAKPLLEEGVGRLLGRPAVVMVRSGAQTHALLRNNPFPAADAAKTIAVLLDTPPPNDLLAGAAGRADEEVLAGAREIYIHYPRGLGASRLRLPAAAGGTGRNIKTIGRLAAMAHDGDGT